MRIARLIIGLTLIVIGIFAAVGDGSTDLGWWLVAALAAGLGAAGLASALRPRSADA